jgi:undecaprenyl-diphosphatase
VLVTIRAVDVAIYQVLNGFAGNRWLDYFAAFVANNSLLKGGLFLAMYWYLWFRAGPGQEKRRRAIISIVIASLVALVATRMVADIAPFRPRPMFVSTIQHHPYSFPVSSKLVNWSAFPSDHATFFFALAFGLAYLSRRLAVPAMLYTAVWICLPRLFLGVHYASDIVVGAAIGIAIVWFSLKMEWMKSRFVERLIALADAKPEVFYAAAFIVSFEMSVLFDDVRTAAGAVFHAANFGSKGVFIHTSLHTLVMLGAIVFAAYLFLLTRSRRRPG